MAADPPLPRPAGQRCWLDGLGAGALAGLAAGWLDQREALATSWAEVQAQRWLAAGLERLALRELEGALSAATGATLAGAALGLLAGALVQRRRAGGGLAVLRGLGVALVALALSLEGLGLAAASRSAAGRPHVVWIVIDSLRADHLGCYGYARDTSPFLDALAARSVRFERALSQESYTLASAASYFTSRPPPETGVLYSRPRFDTLSPALITLPEVLQEAGYDTGAFVFNPHLWARYRFDQGFDVYDDAYPRVGDGRITKDLPLWEGKDTTGPMLSKVGAFLRHDAVADSGRPKLLYLHYQDVHGPYVPPPACQQMFLPDDLSPELAAWLPDYLDRPIRRHAEVPDPPIAAADKPGWPFNPAGLPIVVSQYDGAIRHADDGLRRLFALLAGHGIDLDTAVIVVTADHGEELHDPHPADRLEIGHGRSLHGEQVHVPLIVSVPGGRPQVVAQPVELLDVAPTILAAVGLADETPAAFRGRSLLPALEGRELPPRPVFSGGNHRRGLIIGDGLVYYRHDGDCETRRHGHEQRPGDGAAQAVQHELYAAGDRGQTQELLRGRSPDVDARVSRLAGLLDAWLARQAEDGAPRVALDDEALAVLRQAGYLDGGGDDGEQR